MDIFDSLIKDTLNVLDNYSMVPLDEKAAPWDILDKNIYLFDKETAFELGGYPKESVNMLIQSSNSFLNGFYVFLYNYLEVFSNFYHKMSFLIFFTI